ncbi:hypothetical protein PLANPX_3088 [Lacipirellula parvula]|uniref:Uncharacterized protein n=1 Tax=Lacipirellula parvula TaxID=2650471 RepID=A0A5K7XGR0_9BACT|nr:hypothetical protein PLANPX_3088 [Lacipirellula parvula]
MEKVGESAAGAICRRWGRLGFRGIVERFAPDLPLTPLTIHARSFR